MMQVFPLFQKWNFIHKTRYWDQCFIIPFLWHFWNKKFLFLKYYFLYHHQWENLHKIYERILFLIFTLCYYEYHVWVRLVTVCIFTGKVSKVCRQQIFVRNMKTLIPLVILIFTLFAISEALFFGVPRSSCTHDYQCPRTRKCVRQGNPVCGISSWVIYHLNSDLNI